MKDQIVSFEVAKLAKEIGFDIPVQWMYVRDEEPQYDSRDAYNWNERAGYSAQLNLF